MKHKIHLFIFCYDNDFLQKSFHSCKHNLQALKGLLSCGFIFFLAFFLRNILLKFIISSNTIMHGIKENIFSMDVE